jgi:hypothetical protein
MRRISHGRQERQRRLTAYLTDGRLPDLERGWILLALAGHAVAFLLIEAADSVWVIGTAVRVWRRRRAGLVGAVRTGVHRPTMILLLGANLLYVSLRQLLLAWLDGRSAGHRLGASPGTGAAEQ